MTIQWGDTGRSPFGTLKTINITMATPRENSSTLNPSDTSFSSSLPTVQTASIGATFTIQQSDLPTVSGALSNGYSAIIIVSGKNTSASAVTVNSQCFKNGTSLATASNGSVTAAYYWTHLCYRFNSVSLGDTLNVQVWASATGATYDYCALMVYPTQINPSKSGVILKDFTVTAYNTSYPSLSNVPSGTMNYGLYNQNYAYYQASGKTFNLDGAGTTSLGAVTPYAIRANYSDVNANTTATNNSSTRYCAKNVVPQTITYREGLR